MHIPDTQFLINDPVQDIADMSECQLHKPGSDCFPGNNPVLDPDNLSWIYNHVTDRVIDLIYHRLFAYAVPRSHGRCPDTTIRE